MPLLDWIRSQMMGSHQDDDRVRESEALTKIKRDLTEYTKQAQREEGSRIHINRNVLEDALLHDQIERFFTNHSGKDGEDPWNGN